MVLEKSSRQPVKRRGAARTVRRGTVDAGRKGDLVTEVTRFVRETEVDEVRNLNTGELLQNNEMVLAPELSFNGLIRYEFEALGGMISAQADFNYQDDHFFDVVNQDIAQEDSYTVWNARLGYRSASDNWEVAVWGKNITDEEYRVYTFDFTGPGGFNQQFFAPPSWYGVTLSYRY